MKILHISDTHGYLEPLLPEGDVIVHTGDFLPNRTFGNRVIEVPFQGQWIHDNADRLRTWLGTRCVLLVPGNHDFVNLAGLLREIGIDARELSLDPIFVGPTCFMGYTGVPEFGGFWNHEKDEDTMRQELRPYLEYLDQGIVDVFAAHTPMYGVLDRNGKRGERCGSIAMRKLMQEARHKPKAYLHGHIHESAGYQCWSDGMMVSNAACTQRILDIL